ncbi:MAG TPA: hypothetical protein VJJ55_00420 [Candidatus Paceibacterota bacterium]
MRFVSKKAIRKDGKHQKTVFWSLACLLCIVTSLYVYLVNTAAWNGIRWKKAGQEVAQRATQVSELETRYLSLKKSVTLSRAYALGFEDARAVRFIETQKIGAVARATDI